MTFYNYGYYDYKHYGYNCGGYDNASISGRAFSDSNGDATEKDANGYLEDGLAGQKVILYNQYGYKVAETTTASDGSYKFDGLNAGNYYVKFPTSVNGDDLVDKDQGDYRYDSDASTYTGKTDIICVSRGEKVDNIDAGYDDGGDLYDPCNASITGRMFKDTNNDDTEKDDVGYEPGIAGQTVELLDKNGNVVASTTTDNNGVYKFAGVKGGEYTVRFPTEVDGQGLVEKDVGSVYTDSDADQGTGKTIAFTVQPGCHYTEIDAGYEVEPPDPCNASITGRMFKDTNDDDTENADSGFEPGIAGQTVELLDKDGNVVATTTTDDNGVYKFTGVAGGVYSVRFPTEVDGEGLVEKDVGSVYTDSDADQGTGETIQFTVQPGCNYSEIDAGYEVDPGTAAITGRMFSDTDLDDTEDGGAEPGIEGQTVELLDADGNVVATTTTDENGVYRFDGLNAGDYSVRFPTDVDDKDLVAQDVGDDRFDSDADQGTGRTAVVSLAKGQEIPNIDAGYEGCTFDGTVEGTAGDDLIDANYEGDPECDKIDNEDAILPGAAPNDDLVVAGDGNDTVLAGAGDDEIYGGNGDDSVDGGAGDDTVLGECGEDDIAGGDGDDLLGGGGDNDVIAGGNGNDDIYGGGNDDDLSGNAGDDVIYGDFGDRGPMDPCDTDPAGDDTIDGGAGDDVMFGEAGNDRIIGGDGNDLAYGGDGDDDMDDVMGTREDNSGNDTYYGGAGNDSLYTGFGDDELHGDEGNDIVRGEGGNDEAFGECGDDTVLGGDGDDLVSGGGNKDFVAGNAGDDTVYGGGSDDVVEGGQGNDVLYGDQGDLGATDACDGPDGDDVIDGGTGDDTIYGEGGEDTITGGAGVDMQFGGFGSDLFIGGNGGDMVTGGEDPDNGDFDVLDLTGSNVDRIDYDDPDVGGGAGDAESGRVYFTDGSTMTFKEIENVIPCFTPGTLIATPQGERLVEDLKVGDRVLTRDNGIQEIRWTGKKAMSGIDLIKDAHLKPVLIKAGALGHGLPERDMIVSPNHRVLIANDRTQLYFEESEVLASAKHLVGTPGIHRMDVLSTTYIHFMFDRHEVVLSNGAWTESFQPGDWSLKGIDAEQRAEIYALFPELREEAGLENYTAARKALKRYEAKLLSV